MSLKNKVSNFKLFIVLLFFCFFVYSGHVNAQQISLSISPPLLEATVKPGKSILIAYTIRNLGDPALVKAVILPFTPKNNNGNIMVKDQFEGPIEFSLDNANLPLGQPFFLKTNESQQLLLRIAVPHNSQNGDYYYSLLVQTQPTPTVEGTLSSRSRVSVGSNILLTVTDSGNIDINGKIVLFDVLARYRLNLFGQPVRLFDSNDKIPLVLIVENKGNNLIKPKGEITLKGNFGEKARFEIVPQNILAQSQRLLSATPWAKIECLPRSNEKACVTGSSLLLSGFFLGRYSLSTNFNFGQTTSNLFASTSFYAMPFKSIALVFTAIVIGVLVWNKVKKDDG